VGASIINILFILLAFLSCQFLVFIRNRKAKLLLLFILPVLIMTFISALNNRGIHYKEFQYPVYVSMLFYPYTYSMLALDFSPFKVRNHFIKFIYFTIPFIFMALIFKAYSYSIFLILHIALYSYLLFIIKDNIRLKLHIMVIMLIPSLFLCHYFFFFRDSGTIIISLAFMCIITILSVLHEYSRRIKFINSRILTINSLNKRLNQIITRLRQRNDTLKKIISQKDIELLQIARHASLAEVTTGIAHELAQPLTGIKCISQNMIEDISYNDFNQTEAVSDLTKITSLVDRSSSIIDHIRTFSCKRGFSFQKADLNACVLNAIELINNQMKNSGIELIFVLDDSIPKIYGDNLSLEQLFINFILNSRDAIILKKETVKNHNGVIKITTNCNDEIVKLIIEDNGTGIPEDIIPKIWTPFFTTKQKGKGTGIGLSLSHRIIKEHNADVLISSSGEGTVFMISFPIKNPQQEEAS
jgi:signal transduction histidine kinase